MSALSVATPEALACSPELAAIDILDAALAVASHALLAANPELESDDWVLEVPEPEVQACLADALSTNISALQTAIDRYRKYVVDHHQLRRASGNPAF